MASTVLQGLSWKELAVKVGELFASEDVNVEEVKDVMSSYRSDQQDWGHLATFDAHRYTRNLVDEGNGRYNLILLCWGEGQGSPIHDHADSHCFMKILSGSLKETLYKWPSDCEHGPMTPAQSTLYRQEEVTYINDAIGLHRVENPSHTDTAVSLHLYSPPICHCKCFDQRSGRAESCRVTFHTKCDNSSSCTN